MTRDRPFGTVLEVGSSKANKTGSWRTERPVYRDLMPPCNDACPAGENVQAWLHHAQEGDYERAWRQLMADNPFPAIIGRVCYHPCETACNRVQLDGAVAINAVERFLGDEAIRRGWTVTVTAKPTGRRILVVGAGPSGLSAAYHLRLRGHEVVIRDGEPTAGGMMRHGIPSYRLPRDVLDAEIDRLAGMGVELELGRPVTDLAAAFEQDRFDAVFLAIGAQLSKRTYVPASDAARVVDALGVLHDVAVGEPPMLGRRVVVYGGGNTAMDVARTARRLGAADAVVVYRRTRDRMPAHADEVAQAVEEGVQLRWLSTITQADAGTVTVERMELDDTGFPQPTGEFDELAADALILAIGQDVDRSLLDGLSGVVVDDGVVQVDHRMMTGRPGLFAGGDMVPAERTVTTAVGHGKRAARNIDAWLRGNDDVPAPRPELAHFDVLNPWYYPEADRAHRPRLDDEDRVTTFDEVVGGLSETAALTEARRCLSCGNCFECDNCYGLCPDDAIVKLGPGKRYVIDLDYCKGCGICAAECPAGAIAMIPEEI